MAPGRVGAVPQQGFINGAGEGGTPPYPRPAVAWQILITLFLATVVSYMDRGIIALLIPDLKATFHLSDTKVSIVQGLAFSAFFALASIPVGHLVDRINRRNIIICGILFWSAATMGCGLARNYPELLLARACVGIGEASLIPAAYSIVADCFTAARRGRAMSLLVAAASLGGALSNLVGGLLLKMVSGSTHVMVPVLGDIVVWRFVFLVFGSFGALLVVLLLAFREPARRLSQAAGPDAPAKAKFFAYARRDPYLYGATFMIVSLIFTTTTVTSLWIVVALARVHHVGIADAGMMIGFAKLASHVVGSLAGGVVGDLLARSRLSYGRLNLWFFGMPLLALGGAMLVWPGTLVAFMLGFWIIGVVGAAAAGASYPIIYDIVPADLRGQSIAYCMTISNLVSFGLGPTLPALLNDRVFGDEAMIHYSLMIVTAGSAVLAGVLAVSIRGRFERARLALESGQQSAPDA